MWCVSPGGGTRTGREDRLCVLGGSMKGHGGKKLDRDLEWIRDGDKRDNEILTVKNVSRSKDQKHVRHETTDFRHLRMIFRFELRMRRRSGYGNDVSIRLRGKSLHRFFPFQSFDQTAYEN